MHSGLRYCLQTLKCQCIFSHPPSNKITNTQIQISHHTLIMSFSQWIIINGLLKLIQNEIIKKTSLKIFKHYKLKPSLSIIKDEKAKDKVGVGEKHPHPPKFQQFDQVWSNLIKFDPI